MLISKFDGPGSHGPSGSSIPALLPRGGLQPCFEDPYLSAGRLKPETHFGPVSGLIEDELGAETFRILGKHGDIFALIAAAAVDSPKGEFGIRAFLRHIRDLITQTPEANHDLVRRLHMAQERAARADQAVAQLRATAEALRSGLKREREARAVERAQLEGWAAQLAEDAERAFAGLRGHAELALHREAGEAAAAREMLAREATERARVTQELREARQTFLERGAQLAKLNDSLRIGAEWLGGAAASGIEPSGAGSPGGCAFRPVPVAFLGTQ